MPAATGYVVEEVVAKTRKNLSLLTKKILMTKKKNLAFLAKVENIARLVVYVNMAIF